MMRAFVLTTGRSGSTTFARGCAHLTNYSSAHESRTALVHDRLNYPDRHIEADNRLAWFLGTLDRLYGDDPVYVHLTRDPEETAVSYAARFTASASIVKAFGYGVLRTDGDYDPLEVSRLVVATVNNNIALFLRDKTKVVHVSLPDLRPGFDEMCERLGAEGDMDAAYAELQRRHNKRPRSRKRRRRGRR